MRLLIRLFSAGCMVVLIAVGSLWVYGGSYGLHDVWRHGGTFWLTVRADSPRLSPSMRLALGPAPAARPGTFQWQVVDEGFEAADLPAVANEQQVDHVMLALFSFLPIQNKRNNAAVQTVYHGAYASDPGALGGSSIVICFGAGP